MGPNKLPSVSGRRLLRALQRAGFVIDRTAGSHFVLTHPDDATRTVVVPVHGGRDLKPGTLRSIVRQARLTFEELTELL